ncbi:MAG: amino acid-binding protein [Planctomycetes bacterium]|nr:amino acid-binding protein [Planctomycetota bacterium]
MALKVTRVKVWAAAMQDRPGNLADKLGALAKAGVNLEFVVARRAPDRPGTGVVFATPIEGAAQVEAAKAAGFAQTDSLHSVRIEGPDTPGLGAKLTRALADGGINLRGLSAAAIGNSMICHLALDSTGDADKAIEILKKI